MEQVTVDAGICGFTTRIQAASPDMQTVQITYESDCPHVNKAKGELNSVDAFQELFKKPHETSVYQILVKHLPHVTCPLYSGFLKAIEVAAGMALPKDATISIDR
jgi:NADPH-dependent 7-cyano-7-deazaguanine reductase QueF